MFRQDPVNCRKTEKEGKKLRERNNTESAPHAIKTQHHDSNTCILLSHFNRAYFELLDAPNHYPPAAGGIVLQRIRQFSLLYFSLIDCVSHGDYFDLW